MRRRILLLVLMLVAAPAWAETPVLMVLGDSLSAAYGIQRSQGWVSLLERRLEQEGYPHRVVNSSISGDTTQGGLSRLPAALERHDPEVLVVELGGNDGLRGISPRETEGNLSRIIEQARARDIRVVLTGVKLPPNYGAAFNQLFTQVYAGLASRYGLPLAMLSLDEIAGQAGMIQEDGLHPTAQAQPLILETVWQALGPVLGEP